MHMEKRADQLLAPTEVQGFVFPLYYMYGLHSKINVWSKPKV